MAETIGPGDQVICVCGHSDDYVKNGSVYRVERVLYFSNAKCAQGRDGVHKCTGYGFQLHGVRPAHPSNGAWCAEIFRPIRDEGERFVESLSVDLTAPTPRQRVRA